MNLYKVVRAWPPAACSKVKLWAQDGHITSVRVLDLQALADEVMTLVRSLADISQAKRENEMEDFQW